jgi:hypothetical protein
MLSKKVGYFRLPAVLFYPVLMLVLLTVFSISLFKKIFGLKVIWKDRAIGREDKTCD